MGATYGLSAGQSAAVASYYQVDSRGCATLADFLANVCHCSGSNGSANWAQVVHTMNDFSRPENTSEFLARPEAAEFKRVADAQYAWDTALAADKAANGPYTQAQGVRDRYAPYNSATARQVMYDIAHLNPRVGADYSEHRQPIENAIASYGRCPTESGQTLAELCHDALLRGVSGLASATLRKAAGAEYSARPTCTW